MPNKRTGDIPSTPAADRLAAELTAIAPRWREMAEYGDLIDDYFRMVKESLEATTDEFLRYARARGRRERTESTELKNQPKLPGESAIDARRCTKGEAHD